jgi:hypothetical protein
MLACLQVLWGLSIITWAFSIFASSLLVKIDWKALQNCNLSAASWLALSRICPEVSQKLSHTSRGVHQCAHFGTTPADNDRAIFQIHILFESATKVLKDKRLR